MYENKYSKGDKTVDSYSNAPSADKNPINKNQNGKNLEPAECQNFVEPNPNRTENTQQNPLGFPNCFYSEKFAEQVQNTSLELQQGLPEFFLIRANSSRKSTFQLQQKKKNRSRESVITLTRFETQSIITTIESS